MPLQLTGSPQPVIPDRPVPKYTDDNRPIGSRSVLKGRPVVWAGPDWRWQSDRSFEKLKSSGKLNRSPWSDPIGAIKNEIKWLQKGVQDTNRRNPQGFGKKATQAVVGAIPGLNVMNVLPVVAGQTGRNINAALTVGAAENAAKLAIAATQKARGRLANPESSRPGRFVEQVASAGYQLLGATPPGQQNEFERGLDAMGRSVGVGIAGTAAAAKVIPAMGAGLAGKVFTGGLRLGAGEALATMADDNRGGNPVNIGEAVTGRDLPLAVDVGQDDWIVSGLKSVIPNAVPGLLLSGIGEGMSGFRGTRRLLANRRTVSEVTDARAKLQQAGITEADPATGATTFKAGEATPDTGTPAWKQAEQEFMDRYGLNEPEPDAPAAGPASAAEPRAAAVNLDAEPAKAEGTPASGGELEVEGLDIDPADLVYDPELPEADVVFNLVRELDDEQLQMLISQPGPVVERLDEMLAARDAAPIRPELARDNVMAPGGNIAERLGADGQPLAYGQTLEAMPMDTLRGVAAPDNNPELAQLISDTTGREFEEFTKADIIEGLELYQERTGQSLLVRDWQQGSRRTDEIAADPERFQFKQGTNEEGEQLGNSLAGVDRWDTTAEGVLDVWTDPADGRTYVVNGHNRLARAKQLGVPTLRTNELQATTAQEARAMGALSNIKAGAGTVFDAAKFMRDSGITGPDQLQQMGVPMSSGNAARGLALAQLPDNIFQAAVDGRLSVGKAAAIGGSGLDETQMQSAFKALGNQDMSDAKFNEVVAQVRSAPVVQGQQVDLFGNTEAMSLMGQKADLVVKIRQDLLQDKRFFRTAAKGADRLEETGSKIDRAGNKAIAADTERILSVFDQLKYTPGPVSELLNDGARQIAEGGKAKVIADRIRGDIAEAVKRSMDEQPLPAAQAKTGSPGLDAFADEMRQARAYVKEEMAAGEEEMAVVSYGPLDFEFWGDSPVEIHLRRFDDLEGERLAQTGAAGGQASSMSPRQKAMALKTSFDQARTVLGPGRYILNSEVPATRKMLARLYRDDPDFDWFSRDTDAPSVPSGDSYPVLTVREQPLPTARPAGAAAEAASEVVELTPEQGSLGGRAVRLYRGTKDGAEGAATVGDGLFMTPDRSIAEMYAGDGGRVSEQDVAFRNLLETENWAEAKRVLGLQQSATMDQLIRAARSAGHDGLSFKTTNGKEYIQIPPDGQGPLTPEQRQALQLDVIRKAVDEAEVRPPETPIPELPDGPALTPDAVRADIEAGRIEPGSPAAQALADEIRLQAEFFEQDAQMRAIAEEGFKDAIDYELMTFEEKKLLGLADGYDPEPAMPRAGEAADAGADAALAPAPIRPEPMKLADSDEPPAKPRPKKADQATRQQIQANEQRMAENRRKMQDEGCSL
jgi:hypothetical protein